jgi:hypothetical protein
MSPYCEQSGCSLADLGAGIAHETDSECDLLDKHAPNCLASRRRMRAPHTKRTPLSDILGEGTTLPRSAWLHWGWLRYRQKHRLQQCSFLRACAATLRLVAAPSPLRIQCSRVNSQLYGGQEIPLGDVRSVHLAYCIKKQDDGTYVVLNREYKPLGLKTK